MFIFYLVAENYSTLKPEKEKILESIEDGFTHQLDSHHKASFWLKIVETTDREEVRLLFTITYKLYGLTEIYQEYIYSDPFIVLSNKHNKK